MLLKKKKTTEYEIAPQDYTEQGIEQIRTTGLLSKENLNKIEAIKGDLIETYQTNRIWRTETEMRYSVLDDTKHPTPGMKYIQARLEQDVHFTNLMYLACEYDEKKGELMVLEAELEEIENDAELTEKMRAGKVLQKKAQIRKAEFNLLEMEKAGHHRVREVATWEKIKKELRNNYKFDPNDYEAIQREGLPLRFRNQLAVAHETQATTGHVGSVLGGLKAMERDGLPAAIQTKPKQLQE